MSTVISISGAIEKKVLELRTLYGCTYCRAIEICIEYKETLPQQLFDMEVEMYTLLRRNDLTDDIGVLQAWQAVIETTARLRQKVTLKLRGHERKQDNLHGGDRNGKKDQPQ